MRWKIASWIFFLAIFGYAMYSAVRISTTFAPDFSIFYNSSRDILLGISPYTDKALFTIFNYPLVSASLFIPFSLLPYAVAQTLFTFSNLFSVFFIVYFSLVLLKKRTALAFFLFVVSLTFLSFPTKFTLGMGQTNLLAYLLLLIGFFLLQKKRPLWTVVFLTVAIFLKPILGLSLLVLLFEKEWKLFLLTLGSLFFFAISVPIIFRQPLANTYFVQNLLNQSMQGREVYYNQGLLGFISRLTNSLSLRSVLNLFFTIPFVALVFWKMIRTSTVVKLSLTLTLLTLIDPLSWQHHFVFLILSFLTTFLAIQKTKNKKQILYGVLFVSYVLVSVNIKSPLLLQEFPVSLVLSHQFYGVLLLFILQLVIL